MKDYDRMKVVAVCYRPATDSSFEIDIPDSVLEEARDRFAEAKYFTEKRNAMLQYVEDYVLYNMPNNRGWELERPMIKLVPKDPDEEEQNGEQC